MAVGFYYGCVLTVTVLMMAVLTLAVLTMAMLMMAVSAAAPPGDRGTPCQSNYSQ